MHGRGLLVATVSVAWVPTPSCSAQAPQPLKLVLTIPVPNEGRVDQLVVDGKKVRLFAATMREKQITTAVIDLKSNAVIPVVAATDRAQGAFYS